MWHVDEGDLHAYLDGALDQVHPAADAERIRVHLRECPQCAERLEAEKAVRAEADAILAGSPVGGVEMPPFEDLRARSAKGSAEGSASGRGRVFGRRRLAWAASFVVALGAGWWARQATLDRPSIQYEMQVPRTVPVTTSSPVTSEADAASSLGRAGEDEASALVPPVSDRDVEGSQVVSDDVARTLERARQVTGQAASEPGAGAERVADVSANAADTGVAANRYTDGQALSTAAALDVIEDTAARRALEERMGLQDAAAKAAEDEARAALQRRAAAPPAPFLEQEEAGVAASVGLAHPALPVEEVRWIDAARPELGVRVVQLLPGGERIEVYRITGPGDPTLLAPLADGSAQFVRESDGGWLVLRGPVAADSLAVLAIGLEAAGGR